MVEDFWGVGGCGPGRGVWRWEYAGFGEQSARIVRRGGAVGWIGRREVANEVAERTVDNGHLAVCSGAGAGQELGDDGPDGVQVLAWVRISAGELFGGEVSRRTEDRAVASHPRLVDQPGHAEVGQPQVRPPRTRRVEQEIGRLHITMYDACRMHR